VRAVTRTQTPPFALPVVLVTGLALISAYVVGLFVLMETTPYDVWGALVLAPILIAVTVPALARQAAREGDRTLFRLLLLALFLKLGGTAARHFVAFGLYGGVADAAGYHEWGARLAEQFWRGDFATGLPNLSSTHFIRFLTGLVYSVIGPTELGGFLFYSWLGFWGLFLFYRAFVITVPETRARTYARLLFFMPSLLFWPSSIGKEAWMMLTLGLACFGIAKLLRGEVMGGVLPTVLGLWLAAIVRPHVAGMVAVAAAVAVLVRRPSLELRQLAPAVKVVSLAAVLVVASVLVLRTDRFLQGAGIETEGGVTSTLEGVNERTSEGGSEFASSVVDRPMRAPIALVTVLYRPFVFEAHNTQALLSAVEAMVLLTITLLRWRSVAAALRTVRRVPYLAFVLAYSAMFVVGFSSIANFGILARQRVQLYPLFLVLLCLPTPGSRTAHGDGGA